MNSLVEIIKSGENGEDIDQKVDEVFDFVIEHIFQHFLDEEKLFKKYDLQEYKRHRKLHKEYFLKIFEIKKLHQDNLLLAVENLHSFAKVWLHNHILTEDIKLVALEAKYKAEHPEL